MTSSSAPLDLSAARLADHRELVPAPAPAPALPASGDRARARRARRGRRRPHTPPPPPPPATTVHWSVTDPPPPAFGDALARRYQSSLFAELDGDAAPAAADGNRPATSWRMDVENSPVSGADEVSGGHAAPSYGRRAKTGPLAALVWFPAELNARIARNASKMLAYNLTQAVCSRFVRCVCRTQRR